MARSKPELVILHAAWHTAANYSKLVSELNLRGIHVHIPALPTMSGEAPATADLDTDTAHVRRYVSELVNQGRRLVVLMHCWGGQVGTNALHGLSVFDQLSQGKVGGVQRLVYMAAWALDGGTSLVDWFKSLGRLSTLPVEHELICDGHLVSRFPISSVVGEGFVSDEELQDYIGRWSPWSILGWGDRLGHCAWRELPVTYIQTLRDRYLCLDHQEAFVRVMTDAGVYVETYTLDTGHCPNLTATTEVADIVAEAMTEVMG